MINSETWPSAWTQAVGREVARVRREQGISAQALSDRCSELGVPILRGAVAKLENGRREAISVHELVALACALGVPPLRLLFPGDNAKVEYLPGKIWPGIGCRAKFVGSRTPHSQALSEAMILLRQASDRVFSVDKELRENLTIAAAEGESAS